MYNISGLDNVFDVIAYTSSALQESGYTSDEVEDYITEAINKNYNFDIIEISKERLDECNKLFRDEKVEDDFDDYYSSLWDDDGERYDDSEIDHEEDVYDYMTGSYRKKEIWEYDNAVDDVESEVEAYEGFDSCKNHYWDCSDDVLDDASFWPDKK